MSYVLAFGVLGTEDISRAYVADYHKDGWERRRKWDEEDLREVSYRMLLRIRWDADLHASTFSKSLISPSPDVNTWIRKPRPSCANVITNKKLG